ncbi:hypothetical protein FAZ95_26945 [Trinickia violacea]|uniref:DUF4148 domain-containing protein n=1 Tax=Trinickia violacea TaxID=2571746 RepID=A0A4P8IXU0_9BURK|nr:hypothetical protein [Trinickia violacea]QCP52775.1 hypothetical protein FAZ95_26945 [Trinickia violacea]
MKTVCVLVGGLLCVSAWQAYAADASGNSQAATADVVNNAEGPVGSAGTMSGGPSANVGKTRADVYQDLVRSQTDGEAARIRDFYKGQ